MKQNNKKSESRRLLTIKGVFRSRGVQGTYSIKEITAYVESLKCIYTETESTLYIYTDGTNRSTPVRDPFHCAANDLRNTLLDEVIQEFWNSDLEF